MTTIKCSGKECTAKIETTEAVSPSVTYTCKLHTPKGKSKVQFQQHAFDKDLRRSGSPMGTAHIRNQGSENITADDLTCPACDAPIKDGDCACE